MHLPIPQTAALAGFTAGMAQLPDLDKCGSSPARSLGFVSEAVAWVFGRVSGGHRHATHSFLGIAVFTALAWLSCSAAPPHITGDMLTDSGCMLGFPWSRKRFHLLPEPLAFTTGTLPELLIIDPILSGALLALAVWIIEPAWLRGPVGTAGRVRAGITAPASRYPEARTSQWGRSS